MSVFTAMLALPFMQHALLAGVMLAVLLALLGSFATLRRMAFFGEGIAHASLAGIAIAVVANIAVLPVALVWAVVVAVAIYVLERKTLLPSDTTIGILFTSSMALGVLIMSFTAGYQPDLLTYLFGSILAIRELDILLIAACTTVAVLFVARYRRGLIAMSVNDELARVGGVPTERLTLALYVLLAVAMVLGVKMLGVVLVSALLIIPPAAARLLAVSFRHYLALGLTASVTSVLAGLMLSYHFDTPSGATIVLVAAALFCGALVCKKD